MTALQAFLQQIQPGLTLYLVVITLAIFTFRIATFFLKNADQIVKDHLEKIKALKDIFRQSFIEPILSGTLEKNLENTLQEIIALFAEAQEGEPTTVQEGEPITGITVLQEIVKNLRENLKPIEKFFESASGKELFEKVDKMYAAQADLTSYYTRIRYFNRRCYYTFYACSFFLICILLQIVVAFPDYLLVSYINILIVSLIYGFYSFIQYEKSREALIRKFEEMSLYSKV